MVRIEAVPLALEVIVVVSVLEGCVIGVNGIVGELEVLGETEEEETLSPTVLGR